jgi:hypothetical protein
VSDWHSGFLLNVQMRPGDSVLFKKLDLAEARARMLATDIRVATIRCVGVGMCAQHIILDLGVASMLATDVKTVTLCVNVGTRCRCTAYRHLFVSSVTVTEIDYFLLYPNQCSLLLFSRQPYVLITRLV